MAEIEELKKELERVMGALIDDDDDGYNLDAIDSVSEIVSALKKMMLKQSDDDQEHVKLKSIEEAPPEFRCPISGILMKDPVVIASGQTYEEINIRKWLKDGQKTCPKTNQQLSHTDLIPNESVKKMIMNWCKANKVDMPTTSPTDIEDCGANASREHLIELLERLSSSSISDQTAAVKELRLLTNRLPSYRALFGEIKDAIPQLFSPLLIERSYTDAPLHDDLVTAILNISIHESNTRKIIEESPSAVSFLSESLRTKSIDTRRHAAAALSALSIDNPNKDIIGASGAIKSLIELMEEGNSLALKDATQAISNLCTLIENRERAVAEGAVVAVMNKIKDGILIDEMLEILAMLASHHRTIQEMEEHQMIFCLFRILQLNTGERNKEHCVAIVHTMCYRDLRRLRKINDEVENGYEALSVVARTGTARAKRKANDLLERLKRFAFISHSA